MILVDFSAIMFQSIFASPKVANAELVDGKYQIEDIENVIRGLIISELFDYQSRNARYGNLVICLDSSNNWRRDILSSYKGSRKNARSESAIPFDKVFPIIEELKEQIVHNTIWDVIQVDRAEADDVILVLADEMANKEDVLIISSDKDMIQCQKYHDNITQYSPMKHEFLTFENKAHTMSRWILEHTILGDSADEVPKITDYTEFTEAFKKHCQMTPKEFLELNEEQQALFINTFDVVDKKGNKDIWKNMRLGAKTLEKIVSSGLDEFLDSNELYRKNLERNKQLVLMEYIPTYIKDECLEKIKTRKDINCNKFKEYLIEHSLTELSNTMPFNFYTTKLDISDLIEGF